MTRDYRRGAPARPAAGPNRRQQRRSCVWWFLFGAMLGAFGVGLYWMQQPQQPATAAAPTTPERQSAPSTQPSFVFPNILRDTEVEIGGDPPPPPPAPRPQPPAPATPPPAPAPAPTAAPKPAASGAYVVQVGSFRSQGDAERVKAELALLGIVAHVQSASVGGSRTYRVRVGPYASKQAAADAQAVLQRHGKKDSITLTAD